VGGLAKTVVVVAAIVAGATFAAAASSTDALHGRYRVTLRQRDLGGAAAVGLLAENDLGTWTLTIAGSRWTLRQSHGIYGDTIDQGTFAVAGERAAFTLTSGYGFRHHQFLGMTRWQAGKRTLRFSSLGPPQVDVIFVLSARPWLRLS
jgi:hypothetical protein